MTTAFCSPHKCWNYCAWIPNASKKNATHHRVTIKDIFGLVHLFVTKTTEILFLLECKFMPSKQLWMKYSLHRYPLPVLPPYAHGACYVLSVDLVEYVVRNMYPHLVPGIWQTQLEQSNVEDIQVHSSPMAGL